MKDLSIQARIYVLAAIFVAVIFLFWSLAQVDWGNIWMMLALSGLASLTLILKVTGATERSHYNISFLVYGFTFVLLGPEATVFVILVSNLVEWAWHRYTWYIQCYNIATYIFAVHFAGQVYEKVNPGMQMYGLVGIASVLLAMAAFTMINHLMIGVVIWLARGENISKSGVFEFFPLMLDFTLLCMGVGTAYVWQISPFGAILVLLPLYLIYSTLKVPALERKTEKDPKTGLYNAEYFQKALQGELERANRFNRPLTIVMADLDLLRNINNSYGHLAGDQVLIGVANILKESVRDYDVVSRFGGEEYAIMMPETTPQEAYHRIETMREAIEWADFTVPTSVTPIKATVSFGIAGRDNNSQDAKDLIHNADMALYHVKLKGRNGTFIYNDDGFFDLFRPQEKSKVVGKESHLEGNTMKVASTLSLSGEKSTPSELNDIGSLLENEKKESEIIVEKIPFKSYQSWAVNAFVITLASVALGLFVLIFRPAYGVEWIGLGSFILLVILTEWLSIDIYARNTSVSTSAVPILAGTLIYGPIGALLLSFTFATVAMVKHHSPTSRFIFNFSNQMIAGLTYTLILILASVDFNESYPAYQLLICLVAVAIVYLITTFFISTGMGFDRGLSIRAIWQERFSWLLPYYFGMGVIAFVLIFSYQIAGPMGTMIFLVPLVLLRLSHKQFIDRTKANVTKLKEKNLELENSSEEIKKLNEGLLNTLAEVVDLRDPFVFGHSKQVSHYAVLIAKSLKLSQKKVELIHKAGLLHDIGKLGISETILFKPGKLTLEEYNIVKEHATLGADILEASHALSDLIPIVRYHHERYDGLGYPEGLKGDEIPLEARILCVADSVEAMASDRPYRRGLSKHEVIEELEKCSGSQFDPIMVKAFIEILRSELDPIVENSARGLEEVLEHRAVRVLFRTATSLD